MQASAREGEELVFKALSSGEVVRWIDLREPGATEDRKWLGGVAGHLGPHGADPPGAHHVHFPAPVLKLTSADADGAGGDGAAASAPTTSAPEDDVARANRLVAIAMAVAVVAVLAATAGSCAGGRS